MPAKKQPDPESEVPQQVNAETAPDAAVEQPAEPTTSATPDLYRFTFTGTLIYPAYGLVAEPGCAWRWPDGPPPDGHWVPAETKE